MSKKTISLSVALLAGAASVFAASSVVANGRTGGVPACYVTYADVDLWSRSASYGVYCPEGGQIYVDAGMVYGNQWVSLPDTGSFTLSPGQTLSIWTQDNSHSGRADQGVLNIVQEINGPGGVLAYVNKKADGPWSGSEPAPCESTYADIDLASRSVSVGVVCPDGGVVAVDAEMFYADSSFVLNASGNYVVSPGETLTIWSQDESRLGAAKEGTLLVTQELEGGGSEVVVDLAE